MAERLYDVEVRIKGKDDLTREVKRPKTAIDNLAEAADPRAKRKFLSFSGAAVAGLRMITPVLNTIKYGLRGMQSIASTAFRHITRGAKIAALAGGVLAGILINWGADVVEAENLFEVSMGAMVHEAELWSAGVSKQLRMNENDIKQYVGTFNVMLTSLGLGPEKAFEMSRGLAQLTFDMASFYNLHPEDAFEKLQAGITGEIEPLKRLGIVLNETTTKAYALANGIGAAGGKLTETEKILARYGALLQSTTKAQGDMSRTLESASNRFKQIWAAIKGFGQELGKGIIETKLFAGLLTFLSDKFIAIKDSVDSAAITQRIDQWTDATRGWLAEIVKAPDLWKDIKSAWSTMLESIVIGQKTITKRIVPKDAYGVVDGVIKRIKEIETVTITTQKTLADASWADAWKWLGETALPAISSGIQTVGGYIISAFEYISSGRAREDWNALREDWNKFKEDVEPLVAIIGTVAKAMWEFTKEHPKLALMIAAAIALGPALSALANPIGLLGVAIVLVLTQWDEMVDGFKAGVELIKADWKSSMLALGQWWDEFKEGFHVGVDLIGGWFKSLTLDAKRYWREFIDVLKTAWDKYVNWFDEKVDHIRDKLNPFKKSSPSMVDNWRNAMQLMRSDYANLHSFITANPIRFAPQVISVPAYAGAGAPAYAQAGGGTTTHNTYNVSVSGSGRGRQRADSERQARDMANALKRADR